MKVLWLSNYRDASGWGEAGRNQILALDASGIEVCLRPLKLDNSNEPVPARIEELEKRDLAGADTVIQFMLPHMMEAHSGVRNIGYWCQEVEGFGLTGWKEKLDLMDELWVPSTWQKDMCIEHGIKKPIHIVNFAADVSRYQKAIPKLPRLEAQLAGKFAFYTIGEFVRRKNLSALLKAFHAEFHIGEPVTLVIKTAAPFEKVNEFCKQAKVGSKLYKDEADYHQEVVITDRLPDEAIIAIHKTCDCFVSASMGEAWSIPAFDAMALGRTPIVSESTGFLEFIDNAVGYVLPTKFEPAFGANDALPFLHTSYDTWFAPSILDIRHAMRAAYTNTQLRKKRATEGTNRAFQFSYGNIGNIMKEALNAKA